MGIRYGKFELPEEIKVEEMPGGNFAKFIVQPLERGFGHTLGNALRRILLTSLEAPAVISIKIEGVPHEYMAIEGVLEDMTHIILNVKGAKLRKLPMDDKSRSRDMVHLTKTLDITQEMIDAGKGQYVVTVKDLVEESQFEVVNPEHKLFTVTKPFVKRVDLKVAFGRGYVPSERHQLENKVVDEILIDSIFSPVTMVNYHVENTRVGRDTDYDRLVLEVQTDGRIQPKEALSIATQIAIVHFNVFESLKFMSISFDEEQEEETTDKDALLAKLALRINEIELSVRSTNCLAQADIDTIAELVVMPESDLLRFRNFGKKSLNEIKAKLEEMNLHLGMDLSRYGITQANVKDVVKQYNNDRLGAETT